MSNELKSALELALEKLDQDESMKVAPLTEDQKTRIQEVRVRYKAKHAENEIHYKPLIENAVLSGDQEGALRLTQQQSAEKSNLEQKIELEVAKIRGEQT